MILCIADVLDADSLAELRRALARGVFVDGKTTAGWHARLVKNNTQLDASVEADALRARIREIVSANDVVASACLPDRFGPMLFSRYTEGMDYGAHVDDALMGPAGGRLRSDISFTIFLSDPADYDGGELVTETTGGEQAYKLAAGSMIAYPSTTLHRVAPVTRGERLVVASWLQSHVRAPDRREILFDLDTARRAIFAAQGKTREFDLLTCSYANLLRMWSDT
jgi:PKHD-type hydroxylase